MHKPNDFKQYDSRWGNIPYVSAAGGSDTIKTAGCGPTVAAMAVNTLADKTVTPKEACAWAKSKGYRVIGGTADSFFAAYLDTYGIKCQYLPEYVYHNSGHENHEKVKKALQDGNWAVANPGPGRWTRSGHFILAYGYKDGYVYINDPASAQANRLKAKWSDFIYDMKRYWIITVPEEFKGSTAKNYLSYGDKNSAVGTAQTMLKSLGYYKGAVDNSFGPLMLAAVKSTQKAYKLVADGFFGSKTKAAVEKAYALFNLQSAVPAYVIGKVYRLKYEIKVRTGPGTHYNAKKYSQLTADGRKHDKDGDGALDAGTQITVQQVKNVGADIWVKCPSGWLAAYYKGSVYIQ